MSVLSDYLQEEMVRQDVTQVELERRTGIPDSTLSRILSGEVDEPKPSQIARIAKALNLKFWALMQRAGYTTETPDEPDQEAQRLAELLMARPRLREIVHVAEQLTPEERDATLAYMALLRQGRNRHPGRRSRRKKSPPAQGDE